MDYRSLIAGCAGCARRRAAARAWIEAAIDPSKAINLHATRSSTERKAGADVIGGGLDWFHSRLVGSAGYGSVFELHGDVRSSFPTTGYQTEVYVDGVLHVTCATQQFTAFFPATTYGTSCGIYNTPNGTTLIQYKTTDSPAWIDPTGKAYTMRFVSSTDPSDVIITLDPMDLCFEEPIADGADWQPP